MYEKEFNLLRKLKKQYKEEMEYEIEYIYKIDSRDKIFSKYKEDFLKIIFDFYNYIDSQPSTISIKINYKLYKKDFFKVLCDYLNKNYDSSNIAYFVNSSLDVEESDNLKMVRTKMIITINEILLNAMKKFKTYDSYKEIEPLLLGIRDGFTDLILWGYLDIETAKKDFEDKILTELIKYNKRKQLILELNIYYGNITPLVIELHNNILKEEKFNNIYNEHISTGKRIKMKLKKILSK